jgi:ribosomal-protein-alanine N-acetyltransferase
MRHPVLDTKRLTLRLANLHEAQHIIAYYARNEPHLRAWEPERPASFLTLPYWTDRIGTYADQSFAGTSYRFFLFTKSREVARDTGAIVGSVGLTQIERGAFMCGRLGFSIDAACEGQGLMREALSGVVDFAFGELGLHRIEANHQPQNLRSAALLRSLGFDVQGYARDYLFLNGAWRDHVLTARTAPQG